MTPSRRPNPDRRVVLGQRIVFDTATLLSAALRSSSPASRAFSLALTTGVVCSSEPALDHLASVLARRTLDRYMSRRARAGFVDLLRRHAWLCPPPPPSKSPGKPRSKSVGRAEPIKDLIAFAAAAEADALLTSAPIRRARSSRRTLPILTPEEFIALCASA
jgi:predicted nucleic acid-binding protein